MTTSLSPQQRFAAKWKLSAAPSHAPELGPCHVWTGYIPKGDDYARFTADGRSHRAHRWAWEQENGPVPAGMLVDHKCHRPACVRVSHLRLASRKQNAEHQLSARRDNRSSAYRGVTWHKTKQRWCVQATHNGRNHHGGVFLDEHEAGAAAAALRSRLFTHNDADRGSAAA